MIIIVTVTVRVPGSRQESAAQGCQKRTRNLKLRLENLTRKVVRPVGLGSVRLLSLLTVTFSQSELELELEVPKSGRPGLQRLKSHGYGCPGSDGFSVRVKLKSEYPRQSHRRANDCCQ